MLCSGMCCTISLVCYSAPQLDFILESGLTLSFDAMTRRQCFDVVIVADGEQEEEEIFSVALSLIQFLPGLSVDPARSTARITIVPITPEREQFFQLFSEINAILLLLSPPPK